MIERCQHDLPIGQCDWCRPATVVSASGDDSKWDLRRYVLSPGPYDYNRHSRMYHGAKCQHGDRGENRGPWWDDDVDPVQVWAIWNSERDAFVRGGRQAREIEFCGCIAVRTI